MKQLKILILLLLFISCTNDKDDLIQPIEKCGVVTSITAVEITTTNGTQTRYKVNATLNDNTTTFIIIDQANYYEVGQSVCRDDW